MKLEIDTHTHTLASGHAYSTISEMTAAAKNSGLKALGIAEHAPHMPGSCHPFYFHNLRVLPRERFGIQLLFGAELNIIDYNGSVDLDEYSLSCLDYTIASLHLPCIKAGTKNENTCAVIGAIKNPHVNIIGHPDDSRFPLDYSAIVQAAKEFHVLIELNNSSLNPSGFRQNSRENDLTILNLCKKYETPITIGSDAHVEFDVGNCVYALPLIEETSFPESLIINTSLEQFLQYIQKEKDL